MEKYATMFHPSVLTHTCLHACGGIIISEGKTTQGACCDAIEHGGLGVGAVQNDVTGVCTLCTDVLREYNIYL